MKIAKMSFYGNPNIGLYAYANDRFCLLGRDVPRQYEEQIAKYLGVPVYRINIAGTSLIGALIAGNEHCILVPKIAFEEELRELTKLGINFKVFDSDLTALGNNIACNNRGAVVSDEYSQRETELISELLNVKAVRMSIAKSKAVGSSIISNSKAGLINPEASESEKKTAENILGVHLERTTINFGNPFVSSGVILNSRGLIMGDPTTTIEVMQVQDAFQE
ncbi:MAG: translation initiation factor IF-6 [Candidatus Woesearchaeota archaeon]